MHDIDRLSTEEFERLSREEVGPGIAHEANEHRKFCYQILMTTPDEYIGVNLNPYIQSGHFPPNDIERQNKFFFQLGHQWGKEGKDPLAVFYCGLFLEESEKVMMVVGQTPDGRQNVLRMPIMPDDRGHEIVSLGFAKFRKTKQINPEISLPLNVLFDGIIEGHEASEEDEEGWNGIIGE